MSNYELTYVLRPVEEANLTATHERIANAVRNAGGEIVARNDWGRRRLAYPIQKLNEGYYTTLFMTLPGTAVRGLERSLQLTEDVLRYLVVKVETLNVPAAPAAPAEPAATAAPAPAGTAAPAPQAEAAPAEGTAGAQAPASEAPAAQAPAETPAAVAETVPAAAANEPLAANEPIAANEPVATTPVAEGS